MIRRGLNTKFTAYNLLEACREPGCLICRLEQRSVERYLNNLFCENVNNAGLREIFRLSMVVFTGNMPDWQPTEVWGWPRLCNYLP